MLRKRIQNSLTKKHKRPFCLICKQRIGLVHSFRLCRKCLRDGVQVSGLVRI